MFNLQIPFSSLFSSLGSWWSRTYEGRDQAAAIVYGEHVEAAQILEDMAAVVDSTSRLTVRPLRTIEWYRLEITEKTVTETFDSNYPFAYTCSNQLRSGSAVVDLILTPGVYWTGADFRILDGVIAFATNPFASSFVQYGKSLDGNLYQACELWIRHAEVDTQTLSSQFGYAVSMTRRSSESYKRLLNAVYDAMAEGPTDWTIRNLISEGSAIPICQVDGEVVEVVGPTNLGSTFVATDKNVYKFQTDQVAIVSPGQVLSLGDPITDALEFVKVIQTDLLGYSSWWGSTIVTRGYLNTCDEDNLIFDNKLVPITLTLDRGYVKITWPMVGDQVVVARFFDELHTRGITLAQRDATCLPRNEKILDTRIAVDPPVYYAKGTLAHWLRGQEEASGEPIASDLPAMVNPMQLLFDQVFAHNMIVVRTRSVLRGDNENSLSDLGVLRRVLPASLNILFLLELGKRTQTASAVSGQVKTLNGIEPISQICISSDNPRRLNYVSN